MIFYKLNNRKKVKKMEIYLSLLLIFSVLDIITLYLKKKKRELVVYVIFAIIAIIFVIWFKYNEYGDRFYIMFARLLNLKE
ncbi:hypothetical protein D3C72_1559610 [compost metagenome]